MNAEETKKVPTPITICFSSDNNFAQHLAVTIASLLSNKNKEDIIKIYILDGGISPQNKERLYQLKRIEEFELDFIKIDEEVFQNCPIPEGCIWNLTAYYRIIIPELLPNLDKCIYLDSDMIITGSLSELNSLDIDDYTIAAVPDMEQERMCKRMGLQIYCNSGMLLMNLKKWRKDNIVLKSFDYIKHHLKEIVMPDQDVLNAVLQQTISCLDYSWNLQVNAERKFWPFDILKLVEEAKIIHYVGGYKPWHIGLPRPCGNFYFQYLKLTPWKNYYWSWLFKTIIKRCYLYLRLLRKCIIEIRTGKKKYLRLFGKTIYSNVNEENITKE